MTVIKALYTSPREGGNTATLLDRVLSGIQFALPEAQAERIYFKERIVIKPCTECYACARTNGTCIIINDDFNMIKDKLLTADAILFAAPIFFYSLSGKAKMFVDRCQSCWVKKYLVDGYKMGEKPFARKGFFVSAGATGGKELFTGSLLTMRYFFDALDTELTETLLCRGLDKPGDAAKNSEYMEEAFEKGKKFALKLAKI